MHAQIAGHGLHFGQAGHVRCPPALRHRSAKKTLILQRVSASVQESAQASLQSRALGLGLGLALSLGVTAAPATADVGQDLQKVAGNTTVGQTVQKIAGGGNPLQGLQKSSDSAFGSAKNGLTSGSPALPARDGPSVGDSLKNAFTKSPPQLGRKGAKSQTAQAPDFIRGRFSTSTGVIGGVVLLLASSLLAAPASRKGNPKAAAKGAKQSARKVSGSQPVQKAKGLLGNVRSGGTQPAKKAQSAFGTQLGRAKNAAGSSKVSGKVGTGKIGSKASSAAKQAQQKAPGGNTGLVAGLAAAGILAGGLLVAVTGNKPNVPSLGEAGSAITQQEARGSAAPQKQAQQAGQQAAQKGQQAAQRAGAKASEVTAVPPQEPQGSVFDLTLGPNSEPLNLRPSVAGVDAPKPGGIPVFPPKGSSQEEAGASAAPQEEGAAQQSTTKPKGRPQGDVSALSVQEVDAKLGAPDVPVFPFNSKGNPQKKTTTDQTLEPRGPAAEAQRSADQASQSKSDEDRIDRST